MNPTDEIASNGPAGTRTPSGASRWFQRSERHRWTMICRPSQPARQGAKSAQRSAPIASRSCALSAASGHTSQVHSASMTSDRARLMASRISVRKLTREDGARGVIEQPRHRGVTELLVDPRQAGRGLLEVADLVEVGGDGARQAGLEQVARGAGLAPAVEPGDRAEVDHERADPAQRPRELVVAPQRLVALGVGEHREPSAQAELE